MTQTSLPPPPPPADTPADATTRSPLSNNPGLAAPPAVSSQTQSDGAPRIIDENTDMSTLTDQEIMRLMENMGQEDVTSKVGADYSASPGDHFESPQGYRAI